jgi:hypothetical protein
VQHVVSNAMIKMNSCLSLLAEIKKKFFTLPDLFPSLGFLRHITRELTQEAKRTQDKMETQ